MHHLRSHSSAAEDLKVFGTQCCGVEWVVPSHFTEAYCVHLQGQVVTSKTDSCKSQVWNFRAYNSACWTAATYLVPPAVCLLCVCLCELWWVSNYQIVLYSIQWGLKLQVVHRMAWHRLQKHHSISHYDTIQEWSTMDRWKLFTIYHLWIGNIKHTGICNWWQNFKLQVAIIKKFNAPPAVLHIYAIIMQHIANKR